MLLFLLFLLILLILASSNSAATATATTTAAATACVACAVCALDGTIGSNCTLFWNYDGKINILDKEINKKYLAVLSQDGELILYTKEHEARFILVAGEPLNEPVARGGPFVMNTRAELAQAMDDYHRGKNGF